MYIYDNMTYIAHIPYCSIYSRDRTLWSTHWGMTPAASRMPRPQTPRRTEPEKTMEFNRGYFCAHAFQLQNANFEATSQQLLTGSPNSLSIRSTVDLGRRGSWIWSVAAVDLEGPESSSPDCDDDSRRRIIINF